MEGGREGRPVGEQGGVKQSIPPATLSAQLHVLCCAENPSLTWSRTCILDDANIRRKSKMNGNRWLLHIPHPVL